MINPRGDVPHCLVLVIAVVAFEHLSWENHCMFHSLSRQLCINASVSVSVSERDILPLTFSRLEMSASVWDSERVLIYSNGTQGVRLRGPFAWTGELYKWSCDIDLGPLTRRKERNFRFYWLWSRWCFAYVMRLLYIPLSGLLCNIKFRNYISITQAVSYIGKRPQLWLSPTHRSLALQ